MIDYRWTCRLVTLSASAVLGGGIVLAPASALAAPADPVARNTVVPWTADDDDVPSGEAADGDGREGPGDESDEPGDGGAPAQEDDDPVPAKETLPATSEGYLSTGGEDGYVFKVPYTADSGWLFTRPQPTGPWTWVPYGNLPSTASGAIVPVRPPADPPA
jgi:hypothetical protein